MEKTSNLFSTVAVLMVQFLMACSATSTPTNITRDQYALLALKSHITFDPNVILANNWSTTTSICNWVGVTCGTRHLRVTALDISNMVLHGTIPPHMGNLSFLASLDLSNNSFSGHLPNELVHLRRLKFLNFEVNNFSGDVPPWLGGLSNLQTLLLSNNSFVGTIPSSLSNISKLETLTLRFNFLQGKIPPEIGSLHDLKLLSMGQNQLMGSIPPTIFNISSLQIISFTNNRLSGMLPVDLCYRLPKLQEVYLSFNDFYGQIHSNLYRCLELLFLSLSYNDFSGQIPRQIWNSTTLKELYLGGNNLKGEIPKEMGKLQSLEVLAIEGAGLTGVIPQEIGELSNLMSIVLDTNSLTGHIPATIFNISALLVISLVDNHLSGNLPSSIGSALPNLEEFLLGGNDLSGFVPDSISNASKLRLLDLSSNNFTGSMPNSIGYLQLLEDLVLADNNFVNEFSTPELSFITSLTNCRHLRRLWIAENPLIHSTLPVSIGNLSASLESVEASACGLEGSIPNEIGNLSSLAFLYLQRNGLTGVIPTTFRALSKLQRLGLGNNRIKGSIPEYMCQLLNLGELRLSRNRLFGPLPECLGNTTSPRYLFLDSNRFGPSIPTSLWNLKDLLLLNLSSNSLSGHISPEIGNLKVAILIDLSMNRFSGDIPSTVGGLQSITNLSLAYNSFQGPIVESFGNLVSLEFLDLSHNSLSGVIPTSLQKLSYLRYFNASFNRLKGEIPAGGPFENFTSQSFMSNKALCGVSRFQVPPCDSSLGKSRKKRVLLVIYIVFPIASVLAVMIFAFVFIRCRKRRNRMPIQTDVLSAITLKRITYHELLRATNRFGESNLLGMGSFGSVYKGTLVDGTVLAIKVFNLQVEGAFKSFDVECEILRNIRHRNLTKVISSCSNFDFKALILEYMPNGSLEKWLYSHNYFLDILQRLDIMIDVACALHYLHHDYSMPVVHCDLKPSNVLLDEDMIAHVSDFGIAKFLGEGESTALTKTLATFGYIAPEYGMEGLVSTKCDIYSYGIMLMETFTRRKPTDEIFAGDMSLKNWVNRSLPNAIIQVIDSNLLRPDEADFIAKLQCVSSLMELAQNCSAESPQERITMKDALIALKKIKLQFLTNRKGT
ncbi:probable LRR receptor-like serine/threonine-protein kinase At3g47570 [Cornus florida]|uniref:probable LRR receptor-like serine/threonine-protein kinase At3g47570 n=1 Tax=Cornus florida TaxID=4283 RepID=UPI00289D7771|nr:probable LRR receptor-like serine/threonine-protein kinase At3g47570 [Cornus florida]